MSETYVELARRGWEAAANGDYDLIASLLDPDVKWHGGDPTAEGSCQNRNQALRWMQAAARPVPELVDVLDAGDRVVLVLRPVRGVQEGEAPAHGAHGEDGVDGEDGEDGDSLTANVTTFRDGKVVEMVHYADAADALRAVGLTP